MSIARELVTMLRYEVDSSGLRKYQREVPKGPTPGAVPGMPTPEVIDRTNTGISRLGLLLRGLFATIGIGALMRISDEWAGVEGRVGLVTDGIEQQRHALGRLYEVAQETGQAYGAVAGLFTAVQRNAKELNLALDESLELSRTIGTALTIGGGSAASQEAALIQLQQALGSGTLRGEELNSVMEQAPRLAQAIAEAFEVPVGKLKDLGKEGKLSSKELARGLLKQSQKLRDEFERMPLTFSRGLTRLKNAFGQQVDRLNRWTGAATAFYRVSSLVIDNLETILKVAGVLAVAAGMTKFAMLMQRAAAAGGLLATMLARVGGARAFGVLVGTFARMLAIMTAIYYVGDDILGWINGADSVLGRIIGGFHEWQWLVDLVKGGLTYIKDLLGGSAQSLTDWVAKWGLIGTIILGVIAAIGLIPAAIVAGIVAWASVFNFIKTNWAWIVDDFRTKIEAIKGWFAGMVPEWARNGAAWLGRTFGSGGDAGLRGMIQSPGSLARASQGQYINTTIAPAITVNATSSQPAAVAEAASRGVQRGLGAAAVPMVEAGGN